MVVDNVGSLWLRLSQEKSSICGQRPLGIGCEGRSTVEKNLDLLLKMAAFISVFLF